MRNLMKYKVITEELMKNLVEFLDEIQFEASKGEDVEDLHKINFCTWAINELINSYDALLRETKSKDKKSKKDDENKTPKKKSRQDYVDETFMDWNLPEMSEEEFEKLVDQFDGFLRSWEKEYLKKNPEKEIKERERVFKPNLDNVSQYMSLDEIKEYLLDEEKQLKKELKNSVTLDEMLKDLNLTRPNK